MIVFGNIIPKKFKKHVKALILALLPLIQEARQIWFLNRYTVQHKYPSPYNIAHKMKRSFVLEHLVFRYLHETEIEYLMYNLPQTYESRPFATELWSHHCPCEQHPQD